MKRETSNKLAVGLEKFLAFATPRSDIVVSAECLQFFLSWLHNEMLAGKCSDTGICVAQIQI